MPAPPPSLIKSLRQYIVENERNEELESPDVGYAAGSAVLRTLRSMAG